MMTVKEVSKRSGVSIPQAENLHRISTLQAVLEPPSLPTQPFRYTVNKHTPIFHRINPPLPKKWGILIYFSPGASLWGFQGRVSYTLI